MKKYLLTVALAFFALAAYPQKKGKYEFQGLKNFALNENGRITYEGVVPVEGASQEELYKRAKEWMVRSFVDAQGVIQIDTQEQIMGKGTLKDPLSANPFYHNFLVAISLKEGRYRYEISNLAYTLSGNLTTSTLESAAVDPRLNSSRIKTDQWLLAVDQKYKGLVSTLEAAMTAPSTAKDNW